MVGQQEQNLIYLTEGSSVLPDQAYIKMRVLNGAAESPQVILIRDETGTFMQNEGEITPVENPFGSILQDGDWIGYLAAAKNVQVVEPAEGEAGDQTHFTFEIDGRRLAEYVREQAETSLRESDTPAGLKVTTSPILSRIYLPNGKELVVPAKLTLPGFSVTPTFTDWVSGVYKITLEAFDEAGNRTLLGTFNLSVVHDEFVLYLPLILKRLPVMTNK